MAEKAAESRLELAVESALHWETDTAAPGSEPEVVAESELYC